MKTTTQRSGRIVFEATFDWWQIVSRDEIEIDEGGWDVDHQRAAALADIDADDHETWVARVTEVADRHSAIKVGDYACCHGIGGDVVFVRLS